jgi:hypothetical protein
MNRLFYFFLLSLFLSSCSGDSKRLENEKNIIGDWVRTDREDATGEMGSRFDDLSANGFSFYPGHIYDNKAGFFRYSTLINDEFENQIYLGSGSKFRMSSDSLFLFRPDNNRWHSYKIWELTPNLLKFGANNATSTFVRIIKPAVKAPDFDKIILSTSGCFGSCPMSSIIINSNGTVIFDGLSFTTLKGLYSGTIPRTKYDQLQNNFKKMNFDSLDNEYTSGITDNQTICTTFVKNGKIYKSVSDYAQMAPLVFRFAYVPLENLYQQIPLKIISAPKSIQNFNVAMNATFFNGNKVLRLKQSETFLLLDYLRMGKIIKNDFKPRFTFELQPFSSSGKANTDGRYYTFFVNGHQKTIDIGFNFYDANISIWHWRKKSFLDGPPLIRYILPPMPKSH